MLWQVWQGALSSLADLMIVALVMFVHFMVREMVPGEKLPIFLLKALGGCAALALFYSATVGDPTCAVSDGRTCEELNDDGRVVTTDERDRAFGYALMLLYAPVLYAAYKEKGRRDLKKLNRR